MSSYTLTFTTDVTVTVDGVSVTSPYTLTQSCTIVATRVSGIGDIKVNGDDGTADGGGTHTISLSNTDIDIVSTDIGAPEEVYTVNYTIS